MAQGEFPKEDILMQDNQTAMLLEKNCPLSIGKGSKHINIRYFSVTDKVQKREVKVLYCSHQY